LSANTSSATSRSPSSYQCHTLPGRTSPSPELQVVAADAAWLCRAASPAPSPPHLRSQNRPKVSL
jgi:hypothetical protein